MAVLIDRATLDSATVHAAMGEDGRSGAALRRATLADGRQVVVKHYDSRTDVVMQVCGDERGREVEIFLSGLLDDLPPSVRHSILAAWYDDDGRGVVVMRDLGDAVLSWEDRVSPARTRRILESLADLHTAYLDREVVAPTSLDAVVGIFEPDRLLPFAGADLVDAALRGWEYFAEVAPDEVGQRVLALAQDVAPLVRALEVRPQTLLHGDLSTVNIAPEAHGVTLIDWGMVHVGPGEVDVARLLAGCGHLFDMSFDDFLDLQREVAGPGHDETSLRLALLGGIVWLGWNKALDIVEHEDEAIRARERAGLSWWLAQARLAFETGEV